MSVIFDLIYVVMVTIAVVVALFTAAAATGAIFQTREMTKEIYYQTTGKRYGAK